jgi:hypothetical protein
MKTEYRSPISQEIEQVGRELLVVLYEALLTDGHIDPTGQTEAQIMAQVRKAAVEWSRHRPMLMSYDFKGDLLSAARRLKRTKQDNEAILYYATWFEHWINGVLIRKNQALAERESCQMLRDVNLKGKFTWLLALVHGKRIPQTHVRAIMQIGELRNEFIHYKYRMLDVDQPDERKPKLLNAFRSAETAIRYLQHFEERHFFKGAARQVLRNLRSTRQEKSRHAATPTASRTAAK